MAALFRKLTRAQLAQFLPTPDLIRAFEQLQDAVAAGGGGGGGSGTVTNTSGPLALDAVVIGMGGNDIRTLAGLGAIGDVLTSAGPGVPPAFAAAAGGGKYPKGAAWSGSGAVIAPASADLVFIEAQKTGTIVSATMLGSNVAVGSASVEVWKSSYAGAPPTVANKISAAAPPTIVTAFKSQDVTLTGWTTAVTAGDIFAFKLLSCSVFTWLACILEIQ